MHNFIIISYFTDKSDQESFENRITNKYEYHLEEQNNELRYIAFAAREQTEVEGFVKEVLQDFGIGNEDYISLYYSRSGSPNEILRVMLLGSDSLLESKLDNIKPEDHIDTLSRLLNYDFTQHKAAKA